MHLGIVPYLSYVGHGGADYGTFMTSGWHPTLEFSFAFGQNLDIYPNATLGINNDNVSQSHIIQIKMAQHLDSRCVLLPAPKVPGVTTKARLESSTKKLKPPTD